VVHAKRRLSALMLAKVLVVLSLGAASALKLPTPSQNSQLDRRAFASSAVLGALAFAPLEAQASSIPVWGKRKGGIDKPSAVKSGCSVDKPCAKGATLWGPWSKLGAAAPDGKKKK